MIVGWLKVFLVNACYTLDPRAFFLSNSDRKYSRKGDTMRVKVTRKYAWIHVVFSVPKNHLDIFNHVLDLIERKSKVKVVKIYGEETH